MHRQHGAVDGIAEPLHRREVAAVRLKEAVFRTDPQNPVFVLHHRADVLGQEPVRLPELGKGIVLRMGRDTAKEEGEQHQAQAPKALAPPPRHAPHAHHKSTSMNLCAD